MKVDYQRRAWLPTAQVVEDARLLIHPPKRFASIFSRSRSSLRNDPRLLMMVSRRLEQEHRPKDALRYLWQAAVSTSPLMARERLWPKLRTAARDAVADHNYTFAYELASHNGLRSGADYVEAEFLSGWLALEHLKKPELALKHFRAVRQQATLPATVSRAEYWLGRTSDALNDKACAIGHYRVAAEKGATFYGQLATVRLTHAASLRLKTVNIEPSKAKHSLKSDDGPRALVEIVRAQGSNA